MSATANQKTSGLLDSDESGTVRLTVAEARDIGETAVKRIGYSADDARIVVDQLIDNMLCGYKFAGLPRILAMATDKKLKLGRKPITVIKETPVSALMDAGNNIGYVACYHAAQKAVGKAKTHGIACVGIYNSYYSGRNAYFVEQIVKEGYVAMHTASAQPHVVPPGATKPALGTNPICFGFPSEEGPITFDIGTASLMWGDIMLHAHLGEPLPEGVGVDENGNPTRDASAVLKGGVTPFGGKEHVYKGYGFEAHAVNLSEPLPPEEMAKFWVDFINGHIPNFRKSPFDQIDNYVKGCWEMIVETAKWAEKDLPGVLAKVKPDLVAVDNVILFPAIKAYAKKNKTSFGTTGIGSLAN